MNINLFNLLLMSCMLFLSACSAKENQEISDKSDNAAKSTSSTLPSTKDNKNKEEKIEDIKIKMTINRVYPRSGVWQGSVALIGDIQTDNELSIKNPGYPLKEVKVKKGDVVKSGDELAIIDKDKIENDIINQQELLISAQQNLDLANTKLKDGLQLHLQKKIPDIDIENMQSQVRTNENKIEDIKNSINKLKKLQANNLITAPIDGVISDVFVAAGEEIKNPVIFRLIVGGKLIWFADYKSPDIFLISSVRDIKLKLNSGEIFPTTVSDIKYNSDLQGYELITQLMADGFNKEHFQKFQIGEKLTGELLDVKQRGFYLPSSSILTKNNKSYVFTVDRDDKYFSQKIARANIKEVLLIGEDGEQSVVFGVTPFDMVIAEGGNNINDGDFVGLKTQP